MRDMRIFLKNLLNNSFDKDLSNEPLSAGSISLDNTLRGNFFESKKTHGILLMTQKYI